MEMKLGHHDWRVLRKIARAKGRPVVGRELRLELSRKTKDGTFLTRMVDDGFLLVADANPDPFDAKFKLSEFGKEAAEHGVYELDWERFRTRR